MKKRTQKISMLILAAVILLCSYLQIEFSMAKYTQKIDVSTVSLNVVAKKVIVSDLFYKDGKFWADPECTVLVTIDENGTLVASKDGGTTLTKLSQLNGCVNGEGSKTYNVWLEETYTTKGNETISGDFTIRRYENFTDTMLNTSFGNVTLDVVVDGSNAEAVEARFWNTTEKETDTKMIGPVTANASAVTVSGEGNLTLGENGAVQNNTNAEGNGGGIAFSGAGSLILNGGSVTGNDAKGDGGGIYIESGTYDYESGTVTDNTAGGNGGGIRYIYGDAEVGDLLNEYTTYVTGNTAEGKGPQVYPFEEEVFAVLDANGTLHYYKGIDIPEPGDIYEGNKVEKVYTDFIDNDTVPWADDASAVKNVVVEDEIEPFTTKDWFKDMTNCTEVDLEKMDTSNVTDMSGMFSGCSELETIYVGDSWNTENVTANDDMFTGCDKLTGGADSEYIGAGSEYAKVDGGTAHPGYLTYTGYALVFEPNYELFDESLGSGYPDVVKSIDNPNLEVPANPTPTISGYNFLGWAKNKNATTADYMAGEKGSYIFPEGTVLPACEALYAVWGKIEVTTKEVYVEFVNETNNYFKLYTDATRTTPLISANDTSYSTNLVQSSSGSVMTDTDGVPFVSGDKLGTILTAYAENNYANLIVYSNGFSVTTSGNAVKFDFNPTTYEMLTFTLKPYSFGTELENTYMSDYWMGAYDSNTVRLWNMTVDNNGFDWKGIPFMLQGVNFQNVTFKNFTAGTKLSGTGVLAQDNTNPSNHETIVYYRQNYYYTTYISLSVIKNVQFVNCVTNGCYMHYIHYPETCQIEAGQQPLKVYLQSTEDSSGDSIVNIFSDDTYSTPWVTDTLDLTQFKLSELSTKLDALGTYAQGEGYDAVSVYTTGIYGSEDQNIEVTYTNSAAVKMNLIRHKDNEVITTLGNGTLTLSGLNINGNDIVTDKPLIKMDTLTSTTLSNVSLTTDGFTGTQGAGITYVQTPVGAGPDVLSLTNVTIDGETIDTQERAAIYYPSLIVDYTALEGLASVTMDTLYPGHASASTEYSMTVKPDSGVTLPTTVYVLDENGVDKGTVTLSGDSTEYTLTAQSPDLVVNAMTEDITIQLDLKYYYGFTDESTGLEATCDDTQISATEDCQITLIPEEGKELPSSFIVKVNDTEYTVNTSGSNSNGIMVTENEDGTCTVTIPPTILVNDFASGKENTITVIATAVNVYTVSTVNLNNVEVQHPSTVRADENCKATLTLQGTKPILENVTVSINDIDYDMSNFADAGIICTMNNSKKYTLTIPSSLLIANEKDSDNTIVISANADEAVQYTIEEGTLKGAVLTPHDPVYADENCTGIILTLADETPILESLTIDVNGTTYDLSSDGITYKKSDNVYTLTVSSSILSLHQQESDNKIVISAEGREPVVTLSHNIQNNHADDYEDIVIVTYDDLIENEDGSYTTYFDIADGFILGRGPAMMVTVKSSGATFTYYFGNSAVTSGDILFDPETGKVTFSKEFMENFSGRDVSIDVSVVRVLRQIRVQLMSDVSNLTTSGDWFVLDEEQNGWYIINIINTEEDMWIKAPLKATLSISEWTSEEFEIERVEERYQHMTLRWEDIRTEHIYINGKDLVALADTYGSDDIIFTITQLETENRPTSEASAVAFSLEEEVLQETKTGVMEIEPTE